MPKQKTDQRPATYFRLRGKVRVTYLLGIIFVLVGLTAMVSMSGMTLLRWLDSQQWTPVAARLETLKLDTRRGEDNDSYYVISRYHYQFGGRRYTGSETSINRGYDNLDDFWHALYSRLERQQAAGTLQAWVNPQNPSQAVLDRTLRGSVLLFSGIFGLLFIAFGAAVLWTGRRGQSKSRRYAALMAGLSEGQVDEASTRPFRQGIRSQSRGLYWLMLIIGAVFLLISLPILVAVLPDALRAQDYKTLLILIFPLIGLALMVSGLRSRSRYRRIGETRFFCDPLPGCVGGQVGGFFDVTSGQFVGRPQMYICCVHTYTSGSSKNRTTHRDILFQDSMPAVTETTASGQRLRVVFDVPGKLPVSDQQGYRGTISWEIQCEGRLAITTAVAGRREETDFKRSWEIPVGRGSLVSGWQPSEAQKRQDRADKQARAAADAGQQIAAHVSGDAINLDSLAGRHARITWTMLPTGLVFAGTGVFLLNLALREGGELWVIGPVFTLLGSTLVLFALYWAGRSLNCQIRGRDVRVVRSLFGKALYRREARIESPQQLSVRSGMTVNSGNWQTEYCRLQLHSSSGKKLTLAEGIAGRDAAEALRQQVVDQLTRDLDAELT